MQVVCPECSASNPSDYKFCGECGASLDSVKVMQEAARPEEVTYYSTGDVQVTSTRAVLGPTTYAMTNITSVTIAEKPPMPWFGIAIALLGALLLLPAIVGVGRPGPAPIMMSLLVTVSGIAIAATRKRKYIVRIGSASGESDVLVSTDGYHIKQVVGAMHKAIIERG